ncbi:MAG: DUF364 domain-containing protein [Coriobacteriales bacterium]|jgi:uncharacterized protein (DUF4213/DUF364 family)|nr:DUF364 domain-containing protein [Coriobacteriales bacterium]
MGDGLLEQTAGIVKRMLGDEVESLTVERAVFGLFFSGVKLADGCGGICFTPIKELPEAVCCPSSARAMPLSGRLARRPVLSYLDDLNSANILRKTLAIATLNALSVSLWKKHPPQRYQLQTGIDAFDAIAIPEEGQTVVVGALTPILKRLLAKKAAFTVLETDRRTLKGKELEHYAPAEEARRFVPHADLLVITGTTLLNDTLEGLLDLAKPDAKILVAGPTASMIPDAFFERGVGVLGGVLVTDPDALLDTLSEAGSGYHFFESSAQRLLIENEAR